MDLRLEEYQKKGFNELGGGLERAARISMCVTLPKMGPKVGPRLVFDAGAGVDGVECTPESVESFVGGGEDLFFSRRIV